MKRFRGVKRERILDSSSINSFVNSLVKMPTTVAPTVSSTNILEGIPEQPKNLTASVVNNSTVSLSFSPQSDGGSPVIAYRVVSSPATALFTSSTTSPLTVTGKFASSQSYQFYISAENSNGYSDLSGVSNSVIPKQPVTIFHYSNPTNMTGGWYGQFNAGTVSPTVYASSSDTSLTIYTPWWCDGDAISNNNINLSGVVSIDLIVTAISSSPTYHYSHFVYTNSSGSFVSTQLSNPNNINFTERAINIPLNGSGGNGKIKLNSVNAQGGYVRLHSIKLNY